jgi:uracil-DNA glycosylase
MEEQANPVPAKRGRGRPKIVEQRIQLLDSDPSKSKTERLHELFNKWYACQKCELGKLRKLETDSDEIVFGEGNPEAHVVIVGEAPGEEEERTSFPFIGGSGQLLNQILAMTSDNKKVREGHEEYSRIKSRATKAGMQAIKEFHEAWIEWRSTEFFVTNAVACRPPENRTPNLVETKACWERLWNIIYIIDPLVIIGAGNSAMAALMQKQQVQISKMRGNVYDVSHYGTVSRVSYPIIPIYHPSYLLRKADWNVAGGDFEKTVEDVRKAMRLLDFLRNRHYGTPISAR